MPHVLLEVLNCRQELTLDLAKLFGGQPAYIAQNDLLLQVVRAEIGAYEAHSHCLVRIFLCYWVG